MELHDAFTDDPISRRRIRDLTGAAISQIDAIPDMRAGADGSFGGGGGAIRLRDTNDFVDLSTVTNRIHRYKEYERLRNMAEIEMAMTVFADEACFAGNTKVATPHGFRTLKDLADNEKDRFLVYCYDFNKQDYTLGWAYNARKTKTAKTVRVLLDDGNEFVCTPDHRILMRSGQWKEAGQIMLGEELMPFYRLTARQDLTEIKTNQFPRVYTHSKGWIHERQFVDEYVTGQDREDLKSVNQYCRMIAEGLSVRQIHKLTGSKFDTVKSRMKKAGFSNKEMKWLGTKADKRRVIGVWPHDEMDVYDLSVEKHKNFATDWGIAHNCQKDDDGKVMTIHTANSAIKEELEYMLFHRKMLNFDQKKLWNIAKQLFIYGDFFWEIVIDIESPKSGILNLVPLPADSIYRIETTKGRLIEFQQSKEGPDFNSLARVEVTQATDADLQQATAIRFAPEQIVHMKIGDDRRTFYPYGVSLIEAARGPAHQLRLMEDAMVVYRLCVTGDTRIRNESGWKYMCDVKPGDKVWTFDRDTKLVQSTVTHHVNNGKKEIYRARSLHTDIVGTATHPILARNKKTGVVGYVDLLDLKPNLHQFFNATNDMVVPKQINRVVTEKYGRLKQGGKDKYSRTEYKDKKLLIEKSLRDANMEVNKTNIQKGWCFFIHRDAFSVPVVLAETLCGNFNIDKSEMLTHSKGERNPERINLPEYVTEEFAELLGFLFGDGCINYNGRMAKLLFSTGEHQEINEKYSGLLKKFFGHAEFRQDKRCKDGIGEWCVSSSTVCDILKDLGYTGKATTKRIPEWLFSERKEVRKAFVKGFADADGTKRGYNDNTWNSTIRLHNKQFIEDLKELWSSSGLCSGKITHRVTPERAIKETIYPAADSWELRVWDSELPQWDNVRSVEYVGEEEVFDITVDHEEHNFIANGIPVHNTRAPERRVFYIDVQQMPSYKAEAFIERMKDQFKKKKVPHRSGFQGASQVEERWHAPAADEDYWIPIRPNANTRVETLPGAQNLGEIDDTVYFRNKLFTALNFPKNYFNNEDTQSTRIALSAQDIKFARMIERLQAHMEDAFWDICDRHLRLLGYPEETYEDLTIKFTPPSDWRELTRAEVITNRLNNASNLKGSQLMSDYDILTKWLKYSDDEAKKMLARLKIQKLEDLKLQIIAQNPTLIGVGLPGPNETEVGTEPGGSSPMLGGAPDAGGAPPGGAGGPPGMPPAGGAGGAPGMPPAGGAGGAPPGGAGAPPPMGMRKYMKKFMGEEGPPEQQDQGQDQQMGGPSMSQGQPPAPNSGATLPDPSPDDIKKYDLDIQDFAKEMDEIEVDYSELE